MFNSAVKNKHLKDKKSPPKSPKCLTYLVECETCEALIPHAEKASHSCLEYLANRLKNEKAETEEIKASNKLLNSEIENDALSFRHRIDELNARFNSAKLARTEIQSQMTKLRDDYAAIAKSNEKAVEAELDSLQSAQDLLMVSRGEDTAKEISWLVKNFTDQVMGTLDRAKFKVAEFGAQLEVDLDERAKDKVKFQKLHTRTLSM